jgi:hypothetical protein
VGARVQREGLEQRIDGLQRDETADEGEADAFR